MSTRIAICISTFHRAAGLDRVLRSIDALDPVPGVEISVIIVNNDPDDPEPTRVAARIAEETSLAPDVHAEKVRGLAAPRNRALSVAVPEFDFIAFIDDDSTARPGWLAELVRVQREYDADVVTGPITPRYETTPPDWIVKGGFFAPVVRETGTPLTHAFTNNFLIRCEFLRSTGIRFDLRFGLIGGEDTQFTRRLVAAGASIVWAADAHVDDDVPTERATERWLLMRHRRTAMATAAIERSLRGRLAASLSVAARAAAWVPLATGLYLAGIVRGKAVRFRARCWFAWSRGLAGGLFGQTYGEYMEER